MVDVIDLKRVRVTRVVRANNNLPLREVITGTKMVATQRYSSHRYRAAVGVEGHTAMLLAQHDEIMTDVVDSEPEFIRFEGTVDNQPAMTILDRVRLLISGRIQGIECKHCWKAFSSPKAIRQSLLASAACEALGWEYVRLVPEKIGTETFRKNLKRVQLFRHTAVSPLQELAALSCVAEGASNLGAVISAIDRSIGRHEDDGFPPGFAIACALMVRRVISIDLEGALDASAKVIRAPTIPIGLPTFRDRRLI